MIAPSVTEMLALQQAEGRATPSNAPSTTHRAARELPRIETRRIEREMPQVDVVGRRTTRSAASTVVERIEIVEKDAEQSPSPASRESDPVLSVTVQGPLRPQTVAQRTTSPRVDSPRVVEITIDRIDVRAPKTSSVTQARPATKRAEPTQSLSDYLRERDKGGA